MSVRMFSVVSDDDKRSSLTIVDQKYESQVKLALNQNITLILKKSRTFYLTEFLLCEVLYCWNKLIRWTLRLGTYTLLPYHASLVYPCIPF